MACGELYQTSNDSIDSDLEKYPHNSANKEDIIIQLKEEKDRLCGVPANVWILICLMATCILCVLLVYEDVMEYLTGRRILVITVPASVERGTN